MLYDGKAHHQTPEAQSCETEKGFHDNMQAAWGKYI